MDIRNFTFKLYPMTLAIALCLPLSYAKAATPIEFNPDGQGNDAIAVGSLDWTPGSVVIKDQIPLPVPADPNPTVFAPVFAHTLLAGAANPDGDPVGLPGLNADYEITVNVGNGLQIEVINGETVLFVLDPTADENYFEIYYDETRNANPLAGTGFNDGHRILRGVLTELSGNFSASNQAPTFEDLDRFGDNNWPGVRTISGQGAQNFGVLVQEVDKAFFTSGVDFGTILPFNTSQIVAFKQTNPSMSFDGSIDVDPGVVNGLTGPDLLLQIDANNAFEFVPPEMACRVTGGGNDTSGIPESGEAGHDGSYAEGSSVTPVSTNKNGKITGKTNGVTPYRYTMGGQAGANTAQQPQPKGEWTHSNHDGPDQLKFTFHAGTASAPVGTEIDEIICTDAGFCFPARPAPNKQIDFVGIGTFKNLSFKVNNGNPTPTYTVGVVDPAFYDIVPEPVGNKPGQDPATFHWFQVHIEDLGEPGIEQKQEDGAVCPEKGSGNDPFADPPVTNNVADCGCGDFYHIRIYEGPSSPEDDPENDVIYEVYGYINGGNFQIHPLTGFDLR